MGFKVNADEVIDDNLNSEFSGGVDLTVYTASQLASKSGSAGDVIYVSDLEPRLVYHDGTRWVTPPIYTIGPQTELYNLSVPDGSVYTDAVFNDGDKKTGVVLVVDYTTGSRATLDVDFGYSISISKMVYGPWAPQINGSGWGNKSYGIDKIEYWNGSSWVNLTGVSPTLGSKPASDTYTYTFSSITTDKLRLSNDSYLIIAELYFD